MNRSKKFHMPGNVEQRVEMKSTDERMSLANVGPITPENELRRGKQQAGRD